MRPSLLQRAFHRAFENSANMVCLVGHGQLLSIKIGTKLGDSAGPDYRPNGRVRPGHLTELQNRMSDSHSHSAEIACCIQRCRCLPTLADRDDVGVAARRPRAAGTALYVVVEMKLVRMGAQPDGVDLLFSLVVQPGFNHVAGEHIAAQQERVIAFERVKRLVQRSGR